MERGVKGIVLRTVLYDLLEEDKQLHCFSFLLSECFSLGLDTDLSTVRFC